MNNFSRWQVTTLVAAFFVLGFVVVFVPSWLRGDASVEEPKPGGDVAIDDAHVSHVGDIVQALADSQSRFSNQSSQEQQGGEGEGASVPDVSSEPAKSAPTGWDDLPQEQAAL